MDANHNQRNAERAEDIPELRPGGALQHDEEPAAPHGPSPASSGPTDDAVLVEEHTYPAALPELIADPAEQTSRAPLPDERQAAAEAPSARVLAHTSGSPADTTVFVIDDNVLRINSVIAEGPEAEAIMATLLHLGDMMAGPLPAPPLEDVVRPLSPVSQALFQTIYHRAHQLFAQFQQDPTLTGSSLDVARTFVVELGEARMATATVDEERYERLNRFLDDVEQEVSDLFLLAAARRLAMRTLDSLTRPDISSLNLQDLRCSICFEEYGEKAIVVVLPCHNSHHFHRSCINSVLVNLLVSIP
ncbi:hypothetical protein VP01_1578g5 [Puccinia sorghi]|uniref:RING-type domain-containing protein n=1 Tax=Puccinia sorghi TaxID=27349 RepID=A0A0L6VHP4_9BASI|nr:hypothetical protein VP01_1578g5 [Puccinia sorghi]